MRTRLQVERARIVYRALRQARSLRRPPTGYPIPLDELGEALTNLGVTRGGMLHVQSSITHLYRGSASPWPGPVPMPAQYAAQVIDLLVDLVGPEGTLVMNTDGLTHGDVERAWAGQLPAGSALFDFTRTPTTRGLIAELFRRRPDVVRSVHPWYNMTAWGAGAEELMADHHRSTPFTMDEHSPVYKLTFGGGTVVLLGQGYVGNVPLHLVEYLHPDEFPRPVFLNRPTPMTYVDRDREIKTIDVMLHARYWYVSAAETVRFCTHLQDRYGLFRTKSFSNDAELVAYTAQEQYEATRGEMLDGVTLYDPQFK